MEQIKHTSLKNRAHVYLGKYLDSGIAWRKAGLKHQKKSNRQNARTYCKSFQD